MDQLLVERATDPLLTRTTEDVNREYGRFLVDRMNYCRQIYLKMKEKTNRFRLYYALQASFSLLSICYKKLVWKLSSRKSTVKTQMEIEEEHFMSLVSTKEEFSLMTVNDIPDYTELASQVSNFYNAVYVVLDNLASVSETQINVEVDDTIEIDGVRIKNISLFLDPSLDQLDEIDVSARFRNKEEEQTHYEITEADGENIDYERFMLTGVVLREQFIPMINPMRRRPTLSEITNRTHTEEMLFLPRPINMFDALFPYIFRYINYDVPSFNWPGGQMEYFRLLERGSSDISLAMLEEASTASQCSDSVLEEPPFVSRIEVLSFQDYDENINVRNPTFGIGVLLSLNETLFLLGPRKFKHQVYQHMTFVFFQSMFPRQELKKIFTIMLRKITKMVVLSDKESELYYHANLIQKAVPSMSLSTCKRIFKKAEQLFEGYINPFTNTLRRRYLESNGNTNDWEKNQFTITVRQEVKKYIEDFLRLLSVGNSKELIISCHIFSSFSEYFFDINYYFYEGHPLIAYCYCLVDRYRTFVEYVSGLYKHIVYFDSYLHNLFTKFAPKVSMLMEQFGSYGKRVKEIGKNIFDLPNPVDVSLVDLFPLRRCENELHLECIDKSVVENTLVKCKEMYEKNFKFSVTELPDFPPLRYEDFEYRENKLALMTQAIQHLQYVSTDNGSDSGEEDDLNNVDKYIKGWCESDTGAQFNENTSIEDSLELFEPTCFEDESTLESLVVEIYNEEQNEDATLVGNIDRLDFSEIKEMYKCLLSDQIFVSEYYVTGSCFYDNEIEEEHDLPQNDDSEIDMEDILINEYQNGIIMDPPALYRITSNVHCIYLLNNRLIIKKMLTEGHRIRIIKFLFLCLEFMEDKITLSEQYSEVYYHSRTIKSLMPMFTFSVCKYIFTTFQDVFGTKNPLIEDARNDYFKKIGTEDEVRKNKYADLVRHKIRKHIVRMFNALDESFGPLPTPDTPAFRMCVHPDSDNRFSNEYPPIKSLRIVIKRYNSLVHVLKKYYRFIFFFDYYFDRFLRIHVTEVVQCMKKLFSTYQYLKLAGQGIRIENNLLDVSLEQYYPKADRTVEPGENACIGKNIVLKTLVKYKEILENGPLKTSERAIGDAQCALYYNQKALSKINNAYLFCRKKMVNLRNERESLKRSHSMSSQNDNTLESSEMESEEHRDEPNSKRMKTCQNNRGTKRSNEEMGNGESEPESSHENHINREGTNKRRREMN